MATVVVPIKSLELVIPLITVAAMAARSIPASIDIALTPEMKDQQASVRQLINQALSAYPTGDQTAFEFRAWPPANAEYCTSGRSILVSGSMHTRNEECDLHARGWCGHTLLVPESPRAPLPAVPQRILVVLSSTLDESARRTVPFATRMALHCGASLAITVVLPLESESSPFPGASGAEARSQLALRRFRAQRYLDKLTSSMRARGVRATWETRNGSPVEEIVRLAETTSPDLIIMSPTAQSVARQIANRSRRPVMLSRRSESQPVDQSYG